MLMHAIAASCEELLARTGNPPLSGKVKRICKPILMAGKHSRDDIYKRE